MNGSGFTMEGSGFRVQSSGESGAWEGEESPIGILRAGLRVLWVEREG